MKKGLPAFYLVLFLLASCNSNWEKSTEDYTIKTFTFEDIPETVKLKGKKYGFPELLNPRYILWEGDYLVVAEKASSTMLHPIDRLLHIIDIDHEKHIRAIGKNGMGPGEITMVHRLERAALAGHFWVYDVEQKRFALYDASSDQDLSVNQIRQSEGLFLAAEMTWCTDTTLITMHVDGNDKFIENHINGDVVRAYGAWDRMMEDKSFPPSVISSVHQGRMQSNPSRDMFVTAGSTRDYLEILQRKTGTIISVRGPAQDMPGFRVDYSLGYPMVAFDFNTLNLYYVDLSPELDFVYTLYAGDARRTCLRKEYMPVW